jgi:hypothetical protein
LGADICHSIFKLAVGDIGFCSLGQADAIDLWGSYCHESVKHLGEAGMGGRIVQHAFGMIFRNLSESLKIMLGPSLIAVAIFYLLVGTSNVSVAQFFAAMQMQGGMDPSVASAAPVILMGLILYFVIFCWIAVAWHRFVLLEEYPGVLPALPLATVAYYAWRSFGLAVLLTVGSIPVLMILGLALGPMMMGGAASGVVELIFGLIVTTVFTYFWFRIAIVLPATSVGEPLSLREGWGATARMSGAILNTAFIMSLINLVLTLVVSIVGSVSGLLGQAVYLGGTLLILLAGVSVLTTLYGHLIEGRDLP